MNLLRAHGQVPSMVRPQIRPDFFIVGAPKSGTSSLNHYLSEHPDVFMCRKETHYFATDLASRGVAFATEYDALFADAPQRTTMLGEASVWYMYSRTAIPTILDHAPDALLIAMLRNPVDLVYSKHAQLVYNCEEDEPDFETAWRLESERRHGRRLPRHTVDPSFLLYSEIGRIGDQVQRMLESSRRDRVKLILFDDFCNEPASVYRGVLEFMGLPHDGRRDFPRVNPNTVHRSKAIGRVLTKPPRVLARAVKTLERKLRISQFPGIDLVRRLNTRMQRRKPLSPAFRSELLDYFLPDIEKLEGILGRELRSWKSPVSR